MYPRRAFTDSFKVGTLMNAESAVAKAHANSMKKVNRQSSDPKLLRKPDSIDRRIQELSTGSASSLSAASGPTSGPQAKSEAQKQVAPPASKSLSPTTSYVQRQSGAPTSPRTLEGNAQKSRTPPQPPPFRTGAPNSPRTLEGYAPKSPVTPPQPPPGPPPPFRNAGDSSSLALPAGKSSIPNTPRKIFDSAHHPDPITSQEVESNALPKAVATQGDTHNAQKLTREDLIFFRRLEGPIQKTATPSPFRSDSSASPAKLDGGLTKAASPTVHTSKKWEEGLQNPEVSSTSERSDSPDSPPVSVKIDSPNTPWKSEGGISSSPRKSEGGISSSPPKSEGEQVNFDFPIQKFPNSPLKSEGGVPSLPRKPEDVSWWISGVSEETPRKLEGGVSEEIPRNVEGGASNLPKSPEMVALVAAVGLAVKEDLVLQEHHGGDYTEKKIGGDPIEQRTIARDQTEKKTGGDQSEKTIGRDPIEQRTIARDQTEKKTGGDQSEKTIGRDQTEQRTIARDQTDKKIGGDQSEKAIGRDQTQQRTIARDQTDRIGRDQSGKKMNGDQSEKTVGKVQSEPKISYKVVPPSLPGGAGSSQRPPERPPIQIKPKAARSDTSGTSGTATKSSSIAGKASGPINLAIRKDLYSAEEALRLAQMSLSNAKSELGRVSEQAPSQSQTLTPPQGVESDSSLLFREAQFAKASKAILEEECALLRATEQRSKLRIEQLQQELQKVRHRANQESRDSINENGEGASSSRSFDRRHSTGTHVPPPPDYSKHDKQDFIVLAAQAIILLGGIIFIIFMSISGWGAQQQ